MKLQVGDTVQHVRGGSKLVVLHVFEGGNAVTVAPTNMPGVTFAVNTDRLRKVRP